MSVDTTDVAATLGAALGGRVVGPRRLSGGASRITSAFDLETPSGPVRALILQQMRGVVPTVGAAGDPDVGVEAGLLRAAGRAGVPVPGVVAAGADDGLPPGWLVVERLEGETIPRRILRDEEFAAARPVLTDQTARALAAVHAIDPASAPGLPGADPLRQPLGFLDALGAVRPVLELGVRWMARAGPPMGESVVVHGDFRMGNLLVDGHGLRGVLDWELAHRGDPAEDIGWLCARAWRFGGSGRVGGFGELDRFLATYASASGRSVDSDRVRWWEAYATVKWAVICLLQASSHLSGATRSVELAAIGRRVSESEWDLLALMGVAMPVRSRPAIDRSDGAPPTPAGGAGSDRVPPGAGSGTSPLFGRPTMAELVEAVGEYLDTRVMPSSEGAARFEARVARNVVALVGRELALGPAARAAHADRLRTLGAPDDAALAAAIRAGRYDDGLPDLGAVLVDGVRHQLLVDNPSYLDDATTATG
jgi:aminoglycoside phosphotransferase (APT) family kinase protein